MALTDKLNGRTPLSDWIALLVVIAGLLFVEWQVWKDLAKPKSAIILTMNDVYRINGIKRGEEGGMARIAAVRKMLEARGDVLVLHAGDALSPSLLGNTYKGLQMVDLLNMLDRSPEFDKNLFVTFGNHEFDASKCSRANPLISSVRQSKFTWLAGNLDFTKCASSKGFSAIEGAANVKDHAIVERAGIKIGLFGLTVNKPRYASLITDRAALPSSATTAENLAADRTSYIAAAKRHVAALKADGADYIIGVTHLGVADDKALLAALGADGPDLIIGGHDHAAMKVGPVEGRYIYKETADALDVGVHRLAADRGSISHSYQKVSLKGSSAPKTQIVQHVTDGWLKIHEAGFCAGKNLLAGCLADAMGTSAIDWQLEELKNRESETAIGNWLTEKIVTVAAQNSGNFCPAAGADPIRVGLLGSGSLRLNYDVPAGYAIQRREIEELFPFSMEIAAVCTTWGDVRGQIEHGLSLKGEGGWPHLSGVKISYTPATTGVPAKILSMTTPDGTTPTDDTLIVLVANLYVASQGDGYDWGICNSLPEGTRCADSIENGSEPNAVVIRSGGKVQDLKKLVLAEFAANSSGTVGPTKFEPKMTVVAP